MHSVKFLLKIIPRIQSVELTQCALFFAPFLFKMSSFRLLYLTFSTFMMVYPSGILQRRKVYYFKIGLECAFDPDQCSHSYSTIMAAISQLL